MPQRRGNVYRLPPVPEMAEGLQAGPANLKLLQEHLVIQNQILNQALQDHQNRLNSIQQTTAHTPPAVTGLVVQGKQGLFSLAWNRIKNVDGYVVVHATDTGMTQLAGRYNLPDGNQCTHQVPVGNVAVTNTFQVYAYQGQKMSDPTPAVTATTSVYGSSETAPPAPPLYPLQPKIDPPRSGPNL